MVTALAGIGTRSRCSRSSGRHEGLSIGFVASRGFEAAVIAIGVVSVLAVVTLRQPGATGAEATSLVAAGARRGPQLGDHPRQQHGAFNALMLGTALYRARLVPRAIPALGHRRSADPHLLRHRHDHRGHRRPERLFHAVAVMPFFIWELVLGLWLTFKGFNEKSPIAIDERARRAADAPDPGRAPGGIAANAGAA